MIQLSHLHYWYHPGRKILNDINLTITENEFTVIAGQNGSGKTTMLKNISGLLRPSQGSIMLRGNDTGKMSIAEIAAEIGFVMQDPDRQLFEQTVYDEAAFALKRRLPKTAIPQKVEEALCTVGLIDQRDDFPPALCRADRVKTVFASVLAMGPAIIMLDEPIAGQSPRGCRLIMDILAKLHRQGYTIIMVTHNMQIAAEYAQRLIVMKAGSVVLDGKPADVFQQSAELADAGILPPPITRLSHRLREHIPLAQDALTPAELAEMLKAFTPILSRQGAKITKHAKGKRCQSWVLD
ncbi:MAG: energy-coupling factor ABC transporter ATP-binding protein [Treponema sp.]|nr:energy-coupling factor ABC transporter ATP-binding protein [Treponema sp.]